MYPECLTNMLSTKTYSHHHSIFQTFITKMAIKVKLRSQNWTWNATCSEWTYSTMKTTRIHFLQVWTNNKNYFIMQPWALILRTIRWKPTTCPKWWISHYSTTLALISISTHNRSSTNAILHRICRLKLAIWILQCFSKMPLIMRPRNFKFEKLNPIMMHRPMSATYNLWHPKTCQQTTETQKLKARKWAPKREAERPTPRRARS